MFTGIRAGEKLEEELLRPAEQAVPTHFERILEVASPEVIDEISLRLALREVEERVRAMDFGAARRLLHRLAQAGPTVSSPVSTATVQ